MSELIFTVINFSSLLDKFNACGDQKHYRIFVNLYMIHAFFEYIYFRSANSDFKGGFRGIWKYTISFDYESFLLMIAIFLFIICPFLKKTEFAIPL